MLFRSDHSGVRIFVRGEFVAPGQWLIHATVASGSGIDRVMGAASRRRTLSGLWQGIVLENRVGRHLGAVAVRVVVDGDRDIAGLFAATETPERTLAPAPLRGSSDEERSAAIAPRRTGNPNTFQSMPAALPATTNMKSG